jgi:hypothetical protein
MFNPYTYSHPIPPQHDEHNHAYHIMLDSDFGLLNLTSYVVENLRAFIEGRLRGSKGNKNNKIPLLFSIEDAIRIAKKIIITVNKKGCTKSGKTVINGVVIVRLNISDVSKTHSSVTKISGLITGARDYSTLNNSHADLTIYSINGQERGVLTYESLPKCRITHVLYVLDETLSVELLNNGFKIMCMMKLLSPEHVRLLKSLSTTHKNKLSPLSNWKHADDALSDDNYDHLPKSGLPTPAYGGGFVHDIDYEPLYRKEKQRYLELQKIAMSKGLLKKNKY